MGKHCWKCKDDEVFDAPDNNGMCLECYEKCKTAARNQSEEGEYFCWYGNPGEQQRADEYWENERVNN